MLHLGALGRRSVSAFERLAFTTASALPSRLLDV
jgi:hypothetical protein